MHTGFAEFKALLRDVRRLSVWTVGASLGAPFIVAAFSYAPPPSPKAIAVVGAVVELVALILIFQFFRYTSRKRVNRMIIFVAVVLGFVVPMYLIGFNNYTFVSPAKERLVIGFVCTAEAKQVYGANCYAKSEEHLAAVEYTPSRLWEVWSIDVVINTLTTLWLLCFGALSAIIGLFVVFQRQEKLKARKPRTPAQQKPIISPSSH